MVARTAVLCAIEAVIVALLALQVFAAPSPAKTTEQPTVSAPDPVAATTATAPAPSPAPAPTPAADATSAARSEVAAKWRAEDPVGVLLTGTVRTRDGKPGDASIGAALDKKNLGTSTADDGTYALVGLSPGEWTIHLRGTTIVEADSTLTITDDAVQHRDFVVDPSFPVKVLIVTADGADATRAMRTARVFDNFNVVGQRDRFPDRLAPTDYGRLFVGDATWNSEMNPKDGFAGTLFLTAVPAHVALLQRHLVLEQQVVQPGQQEVKFVVDVEALKKLVGSAVLRVLDATTGEPLAKARVSIETANLSGPGILVDPEGRAVFEGLSPGLLRCQVNAPDHEVMYATVRIDIGQRLDLGDVRLAPLAPLKGTVLDADGKPATANLSWTELKWRTGPTGFTSNRYASTEADGTFSLWGTGSGAIAVTARSQTGELASGVFDNPPANPVVLRLAKPGECTVTRPRDPSRMFVLTLYDGSRRAVAANEIDCRVVKTMLTMPAGDYTFEVHDDQLHLVQSGALTFGTTPCAVEIR